MEQTIKALQDAYSQIGLRLQAEPCGADKWVGIVYQPTPKAKYKKEKQIYGFRYRSQERMIEDISNHLENKISNLQKIANEKILRKAEKDQQANAIKVGDIFYISWGYDQTNVEYFQVISKPSAKTVVVREIAFKSVGGNCSMSEYVQPVKDAFVGTEDHKMRLDGEWIKFASYRCGRVLKDAPELCKHYRSWYA